MNEIDERQQERDKERSRQEEEGRLAEQLRHADALTSLRRGQVRKCRNQLLYQYSTAVPYPSTARV